MENKMYNEVGVGQKGCLRREIKDFAHQIHNIIIKI